VNPKWLLAAPPVTWCTIGITALVAPHQLLNFFPVLWVLNDVSIMLAVAGVMMMIFRGPGPVGPTRDEWTGWATPVDEDSPLEALLAELARRARLEAGRP
jgi:hypothetical protein